MLLSVTVDDPDGSDECVEDIDPLTDDLSPDDRLSPLDKLQKYFQSDDVEERLEIWSLHLERMIIIFANYSLAFVCIEYKLLYMYNTHVVVCLWFEWSLSLPEI